MPEETTSGERLAALSGQARKTTVEAWLPNWLTSLGDYLAAGWELRWVFVMDGSRVIEQADPATLAAMVGDGEAESFVQRLAQGEREMKELAESMRVVREAIMRAHVKALRNSGNG